MRVRPFALLACVAIVGMSACSEDPTEAGNQEPLAIVTSLSETTRAVGTKFSITAYAIDRNNARIPGQLTAQAAGGVAVDSTPYFPELQETRIFLHAATATEGAQVTVTGHGLTKAITVIAQ